MTGMTGKSIISTVLVTGAVFSLVYWRVGVRPDLRSATHGVIVADVSGSTVDERAAIVGLADQAINQTGLQLESTLTVLATGDAESGDEPRLIAQYEVPFSRRSLESRGTLARRRQEILADLRGRFETVPRTEHSPIFLALRRAVGELRARGCSDVSDCYVFIRTDGQELSERAIREAIEGTNGHQELPEAIANEGIRIAFCGLAERDNTTDTTRETVSDARSSERLQEVWLSLFSVPEIVAFGPYCPRAAVTDLQGSPTDPHESDESRSRWER